MATFKVPVEVANFSALNVVAFAASMLPKAPVNAGARTSVGPTSLSVISLAPVTEATEVRAESVTPVAVTTAAAAIEVTAPRLTVVAEIAAVSVIPVRP